MVEALPLKAWLLASPGVLLWALAIAVIVQGVVELISGGRSRGGSLLSAVTFPVVRPARALAPRFAEPILVYAFALGWLVVLRMLWIILSGALGLRGVTGL